MPKGASRPQCTTRVTGSDPDSTDARADTPPVAPVTDTCLSIDIGGTKIEVGIVSSDGTILDRQKIPTDQDADGDLLLGSILAVADQLIARTEKRPGTCGVGCGGPMRLGGAAVSPLNIAAWRHYPLLDRLEQAVGIPVAIENDAKALALAEGWLGAAKGHDSYLAMVVSTGVGGGIVLDGRLLGGLMGNAGHIGHLVVVPDGRRCVCGVRGCLEAEASGTAIMAITGHPAAAAAPEMRDRCGALVGRAVASVVTLLDLKLCVVAGSVALGFGTPFFAAANRSLVAHTGLEFTSGAMIIPAGLGADGPLLGAARVGFGARGATVDA